MSTNYRDIKDELVHCPFNKAHLVKRCRLITHKKICPDKNNKGIIQCPYNPSHNVTIENLEKHKAKCPDRVIINPDLEKEMEEFIKNKNNKNKQNNNMNKQNKIIDKVFNEVNPSGMKDMGQVMGKVTPLVKGKADMGKVSTLIKERLNNL